VSRRVVALLALMAPCVAGAVRAGAREVEYHEKFHAAVEAAEKEHKLVMVVVVAPGKDAQGRDVCKLLREETLPDEQIAKLIRRHFAPFLLDIAAVRQGKQAVPPVVQACFKPNEPLRVPMAIFLDAKCKEVARIAGYAPPANYFGQLEKVVEKAVAQIPEGDRREARRAFERGKAAFARGDYPAALEALKARVASGVPGDDADAARAMLGEIEGKASARLQEAQGLEAQEKLGSAVRAYRQCARDFKGTEAANQAAGRLVEIRKDPDIRKRLADYMAAALLAKAREALRRKRFAEAAEALATIARRYPDAEQAAEAKKLRAQLDADPEAARALRDAAARSEAQSLLSMGDSFRRNGMPDKALAAYRKVVEKFPDTSFAEAARQRIAALGKER